VPKKVEDKLKREAAKKGLTGKRKDAYVWGTMNKNGLLDNKRPGPPRPVRKIAPKKKGK
jgi:hypothetical protein